MYEHPRKYCQTFPTLLALLMVSLLVTTDSNGQGFSSLNGRNHPELKWQVVETAHFEIIYPEHLAGLENEVAAIAEESYSALSANLNVSFDKKIRIYLSDEDEIANGFAMSVGTGHTNIWVHVNDVAEYWTGSDKWIRKVVAHELAHIFHYQAVRSPLRPLDRILGNPLPRFWTEGLAQYQTETWDAFRGEQWLRTAVLDDRLSYSDGLSRWNGNLLYSIGNSQVRYFAEQYGDSTLANLLTIRKRTAFGILRTHDFFYAFKKSTGKSYSQFREEWRRHINIQYNALAATMELSDSLGTNPLAIPGQYIDDVRTDRSSGRLYSVSLQSISRPVTRITSFETDTGNAEVLTDGAIGSQISAVGNLVAFTRRSRGEAGSIVYDLYLHDIDSGKSQRITSNRRASYPDLSPDATKVAYAVSSGGTTNIFEMDLGTRAERQLTFFTGDVQIARLRWRPDGNAIAFSAFDADGTRNIKVLSLPDRDVNEWTDGSHDDRGPVWSPSGRELAYTSLRDGVPNVFITDGTGSSRRITNVVTGASVVDWIGQSLSDSLAANRLIVITMQSKSSDAVFAIDPARVPFSAESTPRTDLWAWTTHRPPTVVPSQIDESPVVVENRRPYSSLANMTHTLSVASPYYTNGNDWGLMGLTTWMEPLGKHLLLASGGVSIPSPGASSFVSLAYVNRQFTPTIQVSLFHIPTAVRPYGDTVIEERSSGGSLTAFWPLDRYSRPYTSTTSFARLRTMFVEPTNPESIPVFENLPAPEDGSQTDLRVGVLRRKQKPYRHNVVHPLDGFGIRLRATVGIRNDEIDRPFVIGDLAAYKIFPAPAMTRFFVYGRIQGQQGRSLAQNYIGLSRYDEIRISSPGIFELTFSDVDRVRGYRAFAVGNRLAFGSIEYRIPVAPSLETRILGVISLGKTTASLFADGAFVLTDAEFDKAVKRLGLGIELKNAISIGGLTLMHAFGASQPEHELFTSDVSYYYRIRTAIPF